MADHETEDEQLRALKEWWSENGRSVIAGVVIGIGTLVGWKSWNVYHEQQALEASAKYNAMQSSVIAQNLDGVIVLAEELKEDFKSTPYASLAAMILAKAKAEKGETSEVIENLQWVIDNSKQESVATIAKLRLARVYISDDSIEKAEALLNQNYPDAYTSLLEELRGDMFAAKGDIQAARDAYESAINAAEQNEVDYLKMKRDNLG